MESTVFHVGMRETALDDGRILVKVFLKQGGYAARFWCAFTIPASTVQQGKAAVVAEMHRRASGLALRLKRQVEMSAYLPVENSINIDGYITVLAL